MMVLFGYDILILTTAHKKENAETIAQSIINSVFVRSQQWKLNLNADKSEVCLFSTQSNNSIWQSPLLIDNQSI